MPFQKTTFINGAASPSGVQAIDIDDSYSTNGSLLDLLHFWFSHDAPDHTMPPRATKPNWQLILMVVSMGITVLTLVVSVAWMASNKSTSLDAVTAIIATNTADIKTANLSIMDLKLEIKGLKDENGELVRQIAEMRIELQAKKEK
jgi:cell division protein FtsB